MLQLAGDVNRAINPKRFLPLMSYNQATARAGVSEEQRAKCKDDKPFSPNSLCWEKERKKKSQQINHSKDSTKCYRQPQRAKKKHLLVRGSDFALHSRTTCVTKCLWVPVSSLVGRGSEGRRHNKREQSALIGVCRERRTGYESRAGRRVALRREVAALMGQTRRYCTASKQQILSLLFRLQRKVTQQWSWSFSLRLSPLLIIISL